MLQTENPIYVSWVADNQTITRFDISTGWRPDAEGEPTGAGYKDVSP